MLREEIHVIKRHICQLNALVEMYEDEPIHSEPFINLIHSIQNLQTQYTVSPVVEMLTVIKYQKPYIFHSLRHRGEIPSAVTMDIRTAEKNLDSLLLQR
ncbi:hypothetical protein [Rossellomorea aquimaris]|uniref:hypothetical protein n=1 Tax=Rossellomorea aquimaris TaxID=189382 RepID=UPI0007D07AE5|nr:hypothetical protein [Rossellomorea aquimaris]